MRWYKILEGGVVMTAVEYDKPVWVGMRNGILLRCSEGQAQGILHSDGLEVFQLQGKALIPDRGTLRVAVEITMTEYEEIINGYDPEDDTPVIPEEDVEEPLTRAELTVKVKELETRNEFLEDCLLEMSEIVYGDE